MENVENVNPKHKIQEKLRQISALFAAQAAIAVSVHYLGADAFAFTGDGINLVSNIASISELKDKIIEEINTEISDLSVNKISTASNNDI